MDANAPTDSSFIFSTLKLLANVQGANGGAALFLTLLGTTTSTTTSTTRNFAFAMFAGHLEHEAASLLSPAIIINTM
jgi:hypothetical protein